MIALAGGEVCVCHPGQGSVSSSVYYDSLSIGDRRMIDTRVKRTAHANGGLQQGKMAVLSMTSYKMKAYTVKPLLSGHPLLKGHLLEKTQCACEWSTTKWRLGRLLRSNEGIYSQTSIKRSPSLKRSLTREKAVLMRINFSNKMADRLMSTYK